MINQFQTAIAVNDREEAIPALATVQVLSLFGLTQTILTPEDLKTTLTFPPQSLLILVESQIREILKTLRSQNFTGAVIILSSFPHKDLFKKYAYILKYGAKTNNATWETPWNLRELLNQITLLEPLRQGNLDLLQEDIQKADRLLNQSIQTLLLAIDKIPQLSANSQEKERHITQIEQQFETIFSPLAKHTPIYLDNYGKNTISGHFRALINHCKNSPYPNPEHIAALQQIIKILQQQSQQLGEDLEHLSHN